VDRLAGNTGARVETGFTGITRRSDEPPVSRRGVGGIGGRGAVDLSASCGEDPSRIPAMVRKKKLSPSGAKDEDGEYHNVHINLHEDELAVAGMNIGDEVFVRVRDNKIIIQKADQDDVEHEF
jgi:hypothetical protein